MADNKPEQKATHAFVLELICHHGGPSWVIKVVPVAKLNSQDIKEYILQTIVCVRRNGGMPIALICDNSNINLGAYRLLGGPGIIELEGIPLYLIFDFVHIFKNIRNNWYTEINQELCFTVDGKNYVACWKDIEKIYFEDQNTPLRMTKLTKTSVSPKPLQRQSVPLCCQVFNDKTVAAFKALKDNHPFSEGTLIFVSLINEWFKMMNVKDTLTHIKLRDPARIYIPHSHGSLPQINKYLFLFSGIRYPK